MFHMKRFLLAALALTACAPPLMENEPPVDGQQEFLRAVFGQLGVDPQPVSILWVTGDALVYGDSFDSQGRAAYGDQLGRQFRIAWLLEYTSLAQTSILHEACHLVHGDPDHRGVCNPAGAYLRDRYAALLSIYPPKPETARFICGGVYAGGTDDVRVYATGGRWADGRQWIRARVRVNGALSQGGGVGDVVGLSGGVSVGWRPAAPTESDSEITVILPSGVQMSATGLCTPGAVDPT